MDFHDIEKMLIPYYEYENESRREITNKPLDNLRLQFEEKDVKHLLVKDEFEIDEIKLEIDNLKSGYHYSDEEIRNLKSKIVTSKQILH